MRTLLTLHCLFSPELLHSKQNQNANKIKITTFYDKPRTNQTVLQNTLESARGKMWIINTSLTPQHSVWHHVRQLFSTLVIPSTDLTYHGVGLLSHASLGGVHTARPLCTHGGLPRTPPCQLLLP